MRARPSPTDSPVLPTTPSEPPRDCPLCPRLVEYRRENQRQNPDWFNGPAPSGYLSSAPMVDQLVGAISLRGDAQLPRGPVLLASVTVRSRWNITVAGALLREAGCTDVLPIVIHHRP